MQYAVLGDIHFKKCKPNEMVYREKVLEFISKTLKEKNIKKVIQLGDFFNDRKTIDVNLYHEVIDLMEKYFGFLDTFTVLLGNHDSYYTNTNYVNSPSMMPNFMRLKFEILQSAVSMDNMLLVPWIDENNADECFELLETSNDAFCLGHFEINGFEMVRGIVSTDKLKMETFNKFKFVLSGHYHLTQQNKNITYVGSLFQNNFGDCDDTKRFFIIDTEKNTVEEIKIPVEFYKKVSINTEQDMEVFPIGFYADKKLQLVLNLPTSVKREKFIDKVSENLEDYNIIDNSMLYEEKAEVSFDEDLSKTFSDYVLQNNSYDETKKQRLNKMFVDIYDKVVNI